MQKTRDVEIAVIGMGVAGIATAYYLCKKYHRRSVLLIDRRDPMSYTSAQSGDNYRNWWPSSVMTQFSNDSIGLMQDLATQSSNVLGMKQRGYALATRLNDIDHLLAVLESNFDTEQGQIRIHTERTSNSYIDPCDSDWRSGVEGVDVVANQQLIRSTFPSYTQDIANVIHIRRGGDFSSQQMAQFMLEEVKPLGCERLRGQLKSIEKSNHYRLEVDTGDGLVEINAEVIVNAAGPFVQNVAAMLDCDLSVTNIFHQKLAFEDTLGVIPRDLPFSIDIDEAKLTWSEEELAMLSQDKGLSWLAQPIVGGIHCRPEGQGRWVKLGWAYNRTPSMPDQGIELVDDPCFDRVFPEIVLRGGSALNAGLKSYITNLPKKRVHYGGYYTMTNENWPLIGCLDDSDAYVVGALSGFGCMTACAAGSLAADWICGGDLPAYARALSPQRYQEQDIIAELGKLTDVGLL